MASFLGSYLSHLPPLVTMLMRGPWSPLETAHPTPRVCISSSPLQPPLQGGMVLGGSPHPWAQGGGVKLEVLSVWATEAHLNTHIQS